MSLYKNNEKHEFAFYWTPLSERVTNGNTQTIICDDEAIIHRIVTVLRKPIGSNFIIFNHSIHAAVTLQEIHKKNVVLLIKAVHTNEPLQPRISMILPLLKRDSLEQALYSLVEVGVNDVYLAITEKVQKNIQAKEYVRLEKIVIAASEQSKNYTGTQLYKPQRLESLLSSLSPSTTKLYADPQGILLYPLTQRLTSTSSLMLMIGPEGDLTSYEKNLLKQHQFIFCALTPTIIQSVHAAGLFAGIWRSILR